GVRQGAAEALMKIGPKAQAAVPALAKALQDKESRVRWSAAEALVKIGPKAAQAAAPFLVQALNDKEEVGHRNDAEALVQIGLPALPALVKALQNKDNEWTVRQSAARVLGAMGLEAKDAVPALAEARRKDDVDAVRKAADEALQRIQAAK